ncbi:phosphatase [Bordetella pertussis]|nr:phosphatase [Bordetella pertussis]
MVVHPDGTGTIRKHYCLGRISHELIQVMPDQRTCLMGDDATNGGLFMFVADRKADLSAGTLYVAKWRQTSGEGPGAGTLGWINLGHARSADIEALADTLTAADIMDVRTADPGDPAFKAIRVNGKANWVRLAPGREQARPSWKRTATRPWRAARWRFPRWKAPPSMRATASPTAPCRASRPRWWTAPRPTCACRAPSRARCTR